MRASVGRLSLILLLLAGDLGAKGSDIEIEKRQFEKGQFLEISVVTFPHTASQCYLITPLNTEIDLLASEPLPDKYEYLPNTITSCRVRINDLDENDRGLWSLHAIILSEDNLIYELKEQVNVKFEENETSMESDSSEDTPDSEAFSTETLEDFSEENKDSVEASPEADLEAESLEISSSEEEMTVETLWLTNLQLIARTGLNVDVNIPRTLNNEKCTLTKPDGSAVDLDDDIPGVTPHSRSVFVSCRVVVGPMDASLLGRWTLCGSYVENNVEHRRCQIAEIVWNTPSNPDSQWQISTNSMFNHPVHFGGTLSPLVRGSGTPVSCHLVTPNGEDLFVTRDRAYPDITLTQISNNMCGIAIGPIAELHLGEWTIYGMFRSSSGSVGYHGVQQPFTMELYDEDNPYAQAYNVTNLSPAQHVINLGTTITVDITGSGVVEGCQVTVPSGETYLGTDTLPTGVTFVVDRNIRCRLSIGPITEDMLGEWLLNGKFSNRNVFTETRLNFTIIQEDPQNPIEEDRAVEYLAEQVINTDIGLSNTITIDLGRGTVQSCHIRTPEGLQYTFMQGFNVSGVEQETGRNVACGVTIRVSEDMIGTWTLIARERTNNQQTERRQPFVIFVADEDNPFVPPYSVTYLNPTQHVINLGTTIVEDVTGTGVVDGCQVMMPSGETYLSTDQLPDDVAFVVDRNIRCRLSIGPLTENMLGEWLLIGQFSNRNIYTEFRLKIQVIQEDPWNPIEEDRAVEYLAEQFIITDIGLSNTITIDLGRGTVQSCHIRTPEGRQYTFMEGFNVPGVEQETGRNVACGVTVRVSENMNGTWTLIARERTNNQQTERRQPFVIFVADEDNTFVPPYDVTYLNPIQHVINLGTTIAVEVNGTGVVDECQFMMPSGETYLSTGQLPNDVAFVVDRNIRCRLSIGPIAENMLGEWLLIGQFSNRNIFTEFRLNFQVVQEDPWNPIEEDREVEYLAEQFLNTNLDLSNTVTIALGRGTVQSCHIRTAEGRQYAFMEGFNVSGVEEATGRNIACGVTVRVSESMIGTWTLIARERTNNQLTERRQPFTIYVAEPEDAIPNEITITKGNSFHVRLAKPTNSYHTCKLIAPNGEESELARHDENHVETCGFVVPAVNTGDSGTWYIYYGETIMYKANVRVNVNARVEPETLNLTWVEHGPVNQTIGPEDAVYCRVLSPGGDVVFDGFGRCQVVMDKVLRDQHTGDWSLVVGMPGRIEPEEYLVVVKVTIADQKHEVSTSVTEDEPTVQLSCSVTSSLEKTGCVFRNPAGGVRVANQGVIEGRYLFNVIQTRVESDYHYSCSLQITDPETSDLGLWRCELNAEENYYGFLTVLCPWVMQDTATAESVVTEPVLTAQPASVSAEENEPATLACAARAPLRYCYFRAPNGTVYSVRSGGSSQSMEYVGAGLDAGECGVRFQSLSPGDSGEWSCHASVGGVEQSHSISVLVEEEFTVWSFLEDERLVIQGQVAGSRPLEYCRFVRFDGLGFISDSPPYPYVDQSRLSSGLCSFRVEFSDPDLEPWTVVAKLLGSDDEVSRLTQLKVPAPEEPEPESEEEPEPEPESKEEPEPEPESEEEPEPEPESEEEPEPEPEPEPQPVTPELPPVYCNYNSLYIWLSVLSTLMACLAVAALVAPSRNRRWFSAHASSLRSSLRASLRKTPPTDNPAA